jgi:hypothetical protein
MLGQSGAEAAQQGDEDEGTQARHAPNLIFNHAALPFRAYERAYEQGYEKRIDVGKVHYGIIIYGPINRLCVAAQEYSRALSIPLYGCRRNSDKIYKFALPFHLGDMLENSNDFIDAALLPSCSHGRN